MLIPFRRSCDRKLPPFAAQSSSSWRRAALRRRPLLEDLEGRQMLSTFTVTNTNANGPGSLRQAINGSNSTPGTGNAIYFDIPGSGVQTIDLLSPLPALTQPVTIDGTTQPDNEGDLDAIQIDGSLAGPGAVGLDVTSSASGSSFHGLSVTDFSGGGMLVDGASNVAIVNDDIGLVQNSMGDFAHGNGVFGVEFENGASNNGLAGDVISGQAGNGVVFTGPGTSNNVVGESEIGTDPSGMTGVDSANNSLANTESGVAIVSGASDNAVFDDVISNNDSTGVYISGLGTSGNLVGGSFIGTNSTGTAALPNFNGVVIEGGASGNFIGGGSGTTAGLGTATTGTSGTANQVAGTASASGTQAAAATRTASDEVPAVVESVVPNPTEQISYGNVISGNDWEGVHIVGTGTTDNETSGNVVEGNYIGVSADGSTALGNDESGVGIYAGASDNTIGGSVSGSGDLISANGSNGVYITDSGTTGNVVEGDFIGTNWSATGALPNASNGVVIQNGAADNTIGGTTGTISDVISGNDWEGVHIVDSSDNVVEGDYIGVNVNGTLALGNAESGVGIYAGSSNNTIGGSVSGSGDLISGNNSNGVYITDSGTTGNVVEGDFIGTNWTGSNRLPNSGSGVVIQNGAADNTIGGTATISGGSLGGAGDVISGNDWEGVHIVGSSDNVVEGDYIGLSAGGNEYVGNAESGVGIYAGSSGNTIGGSVSGTGDIISANGSNGVYITDSGTTRNVVEGDFIGTDWTGSNPMPNANDGVVILNGAADNFIGGTMPGTQNVIAFNAQNGVDIGGYGTTGNVVEGDDIVSNGNNGVQFDPNATQNLIENDVLYDNGASGVYFAGGSYDNSVVVCVIEYNTWGVYDAGSGDTWSANVFISNPNGNV
jgi:hypothetical protein